MGNSLLAQLYPYFKGSQEDVATASLQYIISSNEVFNRAFTKLISEKLNVSLDETYQYQCQVVGNSDNKERPDMAGYDIEGKEKILCESKFYAALTSNQPNTYLKRLISENGVGLVFICPEVRLKSLWTEVKKKAETSLSIKEIDDMCIEVDGARMSITSWREVIDNLSASAIKNNVDQMDINQLRGYCDKLDSDAFIPFNEADFGIEMAIKQERHAILIDSILTALMSDDELDVVTKGLKATPQRTGYTRYFKMNSFCITLEYDTVKWKNIGTAVTPYWIKFCKNIDNKWCADANCKKALLMISNDMKDGEFLALNAPCYVSLDEVVKSMKEQIKDYLAIYTDVENNV